MSISFVIPVYNEVDSLAELKASLDLDSFGFQRLEMIEGTHCIYSDFFDGRSGPLSSIHHLLNSSIG